MEVRRKWSLGTTACSWSSEPTNMANVATMWRIFIISGEGGRELGDFESEKVRHWREPPTFSRDGILALREHTKEESLCLQVLSISPQHPLHDGKSRKKGLLIHREQRTKQFGVEQPSKLQTRATKVVLKPSLFQREYSGRYHDMHRCTMYGIPGTSPLLTLSPTLSSYVRLLTLNTWSSAGAPVSSGALSSLYSRL